VAHGELVVLSLKLVPLVGSRPRSNSRSKGALQLLSHGLTLALNHSRRDVIGLRTRTVPLVDFRKLLAHAPLGLVLLVLKVALVGSRSNVDEFSVLLGELVDFESI